MHTIPHIIQKDSPTFPLYAVVMGKEKPRTEDGDDGSQPEVPMKRLTEEDLRELNLSMDAYEV